MAYKVFSNGDALTGGELNTFLMNQSVITFASEAARNAALTAPLEGQLVWLEDSNKYVYYSGSAWVDLIVPASSGNAIINGAFEINQRNLTSSTAGGYGFDRWNTARIGGTTTVSSETFTPGSAPIAGIEARNYQRTVTSGQSAVGDLALLIQNIESVRTLAGQTATVSFYARSGSGTPKIGLEFYQYFGTGGSPSAIVSTSLTAQTISTNWTRYSVTAVVPSIAGKTIGTNNDDALALNFWFSAGSDWNSRSGSLGIQNNTFDIWGVQLESGSTATPFRRNANSIQGELAACQRYYFRSTGTTNFAPHTGFGIANNSTNAAIRAQLPVVMRTTPTSVDFSTLRLTDAFSGTFTVNSITIGEGGPAMLGLTAVVSSGLTTGRAYSIENNNNAAGFIGFSAEL
jgi:hypothetical protein